MMPLRSSSGSVKSYPSLPRPKRQLQLTSQRRVVRPKSSVPKLRGDQSTLTQLDWASTPDSSKDDRDIIAISSDDEYEEERATKRRRKSERERKEQRQSTLTQMIDRPRRIEVLVDEDGFEIWQDGHQDEQELSETVANIARRQESRQPHMPWHRHRESGNEENGLEVPESSQIEASPSSKIDSGVEVEALEQNKGLRTPSNPRIMEVPSTQTPPSIKSSARDDREYEHQQKSPLKERSANARLLRLPRCTPDELDKIRRRTQKVPLNDATPKADAYGNNSAWSPASSPTRSPQGLERVNTVPDSQPNDEILCMPQKSPQHAHPTRMFKRTATVQDSQFDEEEVLTELPAHDELATQRPSSYHDYTQATFDPVYSALSRDAARFRWTQTQTDQAANSGACEESETDDEDLDRGCGFIDEKDFDDGDGMGKGGLQPTSLPAVNHVDRPSVFAEVTDGAEDTDVNVDVARNKEWSADDEKGSFREIPSSPPCLRSSPESVIVSKPASPDPRSPPDAALENASLSHTYLSEASTIVPYSSPSQAASRFQNAPEASAIPLPPWSSPFEGPRNDRAAACKHEITDWSLPPPPPMSSSKAATPASSSRR